MIFAPAAARFALACTIGLGCSLSQAQPRIVIVNGQRLNDQQLEQLDRRNCAEVPSGRYWIDDRSGKWGYADDARARGVLGGACRRPPNASQRSKLYRPSEEPGGD
jgi:hypothetical protein